MDETSIDLRSTESEIQKSIIRIFKKNIFNGDILIDPDKTVSKEHLRAIIHDEYIGGNNHSRIEYMKTPTPQIKEIDNKVWIFMPTYREYKYNALYKTFKSKQDFEKHRKEVLKLYKPLWIKMEKFLDKEFVIDMRSFETRGPLLFMTLIPFISSCEIPIIESTQKMKKIYTGNQYPYIGIEPIESQIVDLSNAKITFLIDKNTAKVKDPYFMTAMYNLSMRYQIFGHDIGDLIYNQYVFNTKDYKKYFESQIKAGIKQLYIRIPDTRIPHLEIKPIPKHYKPYLIKLDQ